MKKIVFYSAVCLMAVTLVSCSGNAGNKEENKDSTAQKTEAMIQEKLKQFATVKLTADLSHLTKNEKEIISILIDVAQIMDDLYWQQTIGKKEDFLNKITNPTIKKFAEINYGPWERLNGNQPFIEGYGEKPKGANFYPHDMKAEEFEKLENPAKTSLYTIITRDKDGKLNVVWYHEYYKEQIQKAAELLRKAASLAEDKGLKNYLTLRAEALLTDNYKPSDYAWMDMRTSNIDFVVGAIENYEDALHGYKAAFEGFVLLKDQEWSKKLSRFVALLPELQKQLPVEAKYKSEKPGSEADLGVYEALYYAGDCNAGSKTIAINLPNDEEVQLKKGARRLQLKNAMKAKFDNMVVPISKLLLDDSQLKHVKFNAFFENVMFHEVAHGLGIKNTVNGKGSVRDALKEQYSALEEAKADILGLYLVSKLYEMKQLSEGEIMDNYVTFVSGIFRSVRFGAASAHGKANMMIFNYFVDNKAIAYNNGKYKIDTEKMPAAVEGLVRLILTLQGDGNYEETKKLIAEKGIIGEQLKKDLEKINSSGIPVDIVLEQGKAVLGI